MVKMVVYGQRRWRSWWCVCVSCLWRPLCFGCPSYWWPCYQYTSSQFYCIVLFDVYHFTPQWLAAIQCLPPATLNINAGLYMACTQTHTDTQRHTQTHSRQQGTHQHWCLYGEHCASCIACAWSWHCIVLLGYTAISILQHIHLTLYLAHCTVYWTLQIAHRTSHCADCTLVFMGFTH